jgi:hypothetical protein
MTHNMLHLIPNSSCLALVAEALREGRARMAADLDAIDRRITACEQKAQEIQMATRG